MLIAAIDPGLSGGLAKLETPDRHTLATRFEWRPMPILKVQLSKKGKTRSWIDVEKVLSFLSSSGRLDALILEQQAPRQGEGSVSSHSNGGNYGALRTMAIVNLSHAPLLMPHPALWKPDIGVPADKVEATRICREVFGENAPDKDGPAEALLMCWWYSVKRERDGDGANQGILVEPRAVRTKAAFLAGFDPGRSGVCDLGHAPHRAGAAGRLFAGRDRRDGAPDAAGRGDAGPRRRRAGVPYPALQEA